VSIAKKEIVKQLEEFSILIELTGGNTFRARAYANAARRLRSFEGDLDALIASGELTSLRGIGKGLAEKIASLYHHGEDEELEELRRELPGELREMLRIPGLGPRKVHALYEQLGVRTLDELEAACREQRVSRLRGFGRRSEAAILEGIAAVRRYGSRQLLPPSQAQAAELVAALRGVPGVGELAVVGDLRRCLETIERIELLASCAGAGAAEELAEAFATHPLVRRVLERGAGGVTVRLVSGIPAVLHLAAPESFAAALVLRTGSEEHVEQLRARARAMGLELGEQGLVKEGSVVETASEEELYARLELPCVPPELREGRGEIEAVAAGALPELITSQDIRGVFHVHTTYSDGRSTLEEMALGARELGLEYLGVADHSRSAYYAGGLPVERVREQWREIAALNERGLGIRLLRGIESDILPDGSLDYEDELLAEFDFVVASVHSKMKMDRESMTQRILRALAHPRLTMLGHPTGRLLLAREPYAVDMEAVLRAAAEHGVIIELNANPQRLDIDWRWLPRARELGVRIAINPDSHRVEDIEEVFAGVCTARKGWLTPRDVLNHLPLEEVLAALRR
jgi:DNA polymerase (family 10)